MGNWRTVKIVAGELSQQCLQLLDVSIAGEPSRSFTGFSKDVEILRSARLSDLFCVVFDDGEDAASSRW